jgi:hypothetical protein
MSLLRSILPCLALLLSLFVFACGDGVTDPVAWPTSLEVPFDIVLDVRANLVRHYAGSAKVSRPEPPASPDRKIRFDFQEISRRTTPEREAAVSGEFLFSADEGPVRRGRITVFFTSHRHGWARTGQFRIDEAPVASRVLSLIVRDLVSERPLAGAQVEARRVEDRVRSSRVAHTDDAGRVDLEVFPGAFQVFASHEEYRATLTDVISVGDAPAPATIELAPAGEPVQL